MVCIKIIATIVFIACTLCGCVTDDPLISQALTLRERILNAKSCSFQATVTANYQDSVYTFQMDCIASGSDTVQFSVTQPESIAGITGRITAIDGELLFDDTVLLFPLMADGELSPVSAPWLFYKTLCSGYLNGCSKDGEKINLYIDDSYDENPLQLQIQTDLEMVPEDVQIIWHNRQILSMRIHNFIIQ